MATLKQMFCQVTESPEEEKKGLVGSCHYEAWLILEIHQNVCVRERESLPRNNKRQDTHLAFPKIQSIYFKNFKNME